MIELRIIKIVALVIALVTIILSLCLFRNKRKEIALALFTVVFCLSLFEVFLRFFYPQVHEHDKMFEYDQMLGWRFIANKKGAITWPPGTNHFIKTNSSGFRDDPLPLNNSEKRKILVLGDSFVSNISVKDKDVFTEVMERELNNTSVINFGVNGYNQVQEYLLLKKRLDVINPDFVILVIYIRNDFTENIGDTWLWPHPYPRPNASLDEEDGSLQLHPAPALQPRDEIKSPFWLFYRQLQLYNFIQPKLGVLVKRFFKKSKAKHKPSVDTPPELYLCPKVLSEETDLMYKIMEKLLLEIASVIRKRDIPFLFVIAPSIVQVEQDSWNSTLRNLGEDYDDYDLLLPNKKLIKFAESNNLPMFDLLPILRAKAQKEKMLYHPAEQHWTQDGNYVVAHALLDYLRSEILK